ncbi:MAG: methyltransferase [Planctomycetes bacterium]|nr:methyltransferase [Planctomycetota bacterium]
MALNPRSRTRLTRYTTSEFSGDTLRDALGRTLSDAECLPRKEFFEAWETARRIRRHFRGGPVLELAAGHGLLSHILLLLDRTSSHAVCVDRRKPVSFGRLHTALVARWPHLEGRIQYREEKIQAATVEPGALVVAVHACGGLTDLALDLALGAQSRVAVLPCCQVTKRGGTSGLEGWIEPQLAVDVTRLFRLRAAGYRVFAKQIPAEITPQNRLLLGEPSS